MQDGHPPHRALIEIIPNEGIELGHVHPAVIVGLANGGDEPLDSLRGHTPPAQSAQGSKAWIVPAVYYTGFHQFTQFPLAHHGVSQVEAGEFDLTGFKLA